MEAFSDLELKNGLEKALSGSLGGVRRIVQMSRRPFASRTSHFMEEVELRLSDGLRLAIVAKQLGRQGMLAEAAGVKPPALLSPKREIAVYQQALGQAELGTPRCYGAVVQAERSCLFLERVDGKELFQFGELETWKSACRWLAKLHARFQDSASELTERAHLLEYDLRFFQQWADRAQAALLRDSRLGSSEKTAFNRIREGYRHIAEGLTRLPRTLIHGEFYASNILVDAGEDPLRICPVDWEMAAWGPGLVDLAALTAGRWTPAEKAELTEEYRRQALHWQVNLPPDFERSLDRCRLHLAMLWLGWSADWTPPEEHRHDWLQEALELGRQLA